MGFARKTLQRVAFALMGSKAGAHLRQLKDSQRLPVQQLQDAQHARLSRLLKHAYDNVPYYREVMTAAGITGDFQQPADLLRRLPYLDRQALLANGETLKSADLGRRKWKANTSGGSTGEPVRFIQDLEYLDWARAVTSLFDQWAGYHMGMPKILLWGSERDLLVGKETPEFRAKRLIKNEIILNSFKMTPEHMRKYVDIINASSAQHMLAYAEGVYELSRFIEQEGLAVRPIRVIATAAGTLHPHMRETIERVFRAHTFNRYGSREMAGAASECDQQTGLHVSALTHYIEIVRPDGTPADPGEMGEILVTPMTNYAMPMLRYRIGDMAMWAEGDCPCGCTWPRLAQIVGRVTDVFVRRDGSVVTPEFFIHIVGVVCNTGWIKRFQVIQEDYERIRILIVPTEAGADVAQQSEAAMEDIRTKLRVCMGADCVIDFEFVETIEPSPSGKYLYTVSKIARK